MDDPRELARVLFTFSKESWRKTTTRQTTLLTESEFLVLDFLAQHGSGSVGDVLKDVGVLPAQMSRLVQRLEQAGFITVALQTEDRRKRSITLTEDGAAAHHEYQDAKLAPIVTAFERLTPHQRSQFMSLVKKMVAE